MNSLILCTVFLLYFEYYTHCADASQYVNVGCFKDKSRKEARALPELLANYRGNIDWNNLHEHEKEVVEKCAQKAKEKKYMYFAIQYYGECWSGATAPKTYDRYGSSSRCKSLVGTALTNVVYRFVGDEQECVRYKTLNTASRSASSVLPKGVSPACDKDLTTGWYRFQNPSGDQMASKCPPLGTCGTVVTGWLSFPHPSMTDGIVNGKVCFNSGSDCCRWNQYIKLRNCGRFYVYKLAGTKACQMRFCGNTVSV